MVEETGDANLILSMLERLHQSGSQTEPDPAKVQQLVDMGFGKDEAEYLKV